MRTIGRTAAVVAALGFAFTALAGGLVRNVAAQTPDKSNVVLVFDVSASILNDKTNRNRFGAALEALAARVVEPDVVKDLVGGDTTVTFVQFATRAADYRGCTELKLLGSPTAVNGFSKCLQAMASAYRKGPTPALTAAVGIDTNYVAAMQRAAVHLPADAERPALILFTDGRHDVKGVPASAVIPDIYNIF
jgi:hypothetical protein